MTISRTLTASLVIAAAACETPTPSDDTALPDVPVVVEVGTPDVGVDAGEAGPDAPVDAAEPALCNAAFVSATLGRSCSLDGECDDDCPCNGRERCDANVCVGSEPISCDDGDTCTDDSCSELGCENSIRDRDRDSFPDALCGGDDCNDASAMVNPGRVETCDNLVDDDCDGLYDSREPVCRPGESCDAPIPIELLAGGTTTVRGSFRGTLRDFPTYEDCGSRAYVHDQTFSFTLTEPTDLEIGIPTSSAFPLVGGVLLRRRADCAAPFDPPPAGGGAPLACTSGTLPPALARRLPAGQYVLIVMGNLEADYELTIDTSPLPPLPSTELCDTAPSYDVAPVSERALDDHDTSCGWSDSPDAALRFTLDEARDVTLTTVNHHGETSAYLGGTLALSRACDPESEIACRASSEIPFSGVTARNLAAGTYFVVMEPPPRVSASEFTPSLSLVTYPPSTGPIAPGDDCTMPMVIGASGTATVDSTTLRPGADVGQSGITDAVFRFDLTAASDVHVALSGPSLGPGVVFPGACGDYRDLDARFAVGTDAVLRDLPPATYYLAGAVSSGSLRATVTTGPPTTAPEPATCALALSLGDDAAVDRFDFLRGMGDDFASGSCRDCPDVFYRIDVPVRSRVHVQVDAGRTRPLTATLIPWCGTVGAATGDADFTRDLDAGTYHLAVDGMPEGLSNGGFRLRITRTPL